MDLRGLSAMDVKGDLRASVVVFLVALPLAMGISIASGYPPVAGLITGIVGGILVGLLSGAPLQVSGAAAGLTVVAYQGVQEYGLAGMAVALLLAGLMQVVAAFAGLARWFQAVSPTVLHAMLAGIGILIVASQFHVMLDLSPQGSGLDNLAAIPQSLGKVLALQNEVTLAAAGLGVLAIAIMLFWPKLGPGRLKKLLPAPLVAVVVCSIWAFMVELPVNYVKIPSDLFGSWTFSALDLGILSERPGIILAALQIALIASAESLLCAAAVDQLHHGARANFNKELAAQGIGNAVCGILGGLPMTGVIVRSSANVDAGATSRLSTIFHGLWLLLFVALLPQILAFIPIAALAGVLVFTGMKLVSTKEIKLIASYGHSEILIYLVTVSVVVCYDLLFGVLLGLSIASLKLLRQLTHLSATLQQDKAMQKYVIDLQGSATFLRLPTLVGVLEQVPPGTNVEIKSRLHLIDPACAEHFGSWKNRHEKKGGRIEVIGKQLIV